MTTTRTVPVSVIVPAYNAELTIAETLRSVSTQSVSVAEVIVIDDGSTDGTATIAREFGAIVHSQPNRGLPEARNAGIRLATQPWIALLDADDLWVANKIERQWEAHEICPEAGLIVCDTTLFQDGTGEIIKESLLRSEDMSYLPLRRTMVAADVAYFERIEPDFHTVGMFLQPSTALVQKRVLMDAGLFREPAAVSDCECFLRVLRRTGLLVVESPLMRYRVHATNMSHDELRMFVEYIRMAEMIISDPNDYADGAAAAVSAALPSRMETAVQLLIKAGRNVESRSMLRRRMRMGVTPRHISLLVASLLPPSAIRLLLRIKSLLRRSSDPRTS